MTELDAVDRALLERLQAPLPLVSQPFAALGQDLGIDETDVLDRIHRLQANGVIRQIGPIFDTRRLGYGSTLVAFHVPEEALEDVAGQVNAHPGVSHNYARPHHYNLWFTLAVPPGQDLAAEIDRLARQAGVDDWLNLPALRVFKIKTHFGLSGSAGPGAKPARSRRGAGREENPAASGAATNRGVAPADIPLIRALQAPLPLVSRPFAALAAEQGLAEEALLDGAERLQAAGIMRRFSAVLRHRRVGYTANGMACWAVPLERIEAVGPVAAQFREVSHCYQRPAYPPRWPYTLFTMIHGQSREEVEAIVARIAQKTGINEYQVLYSTREFKKERIKYYQG
ncbi:MAG: AsnC family transcriptional regulator [Anaerolineae bacterium]